MKLRAGQTLGVVGESGSGKTTLGLAMLRLISSKGPITYAGKRIDGLQSKEMRPLRRDMQIVFQDPFGSLSPRLSVFEILEEGLLIQRPDLSYEQRRERAKAALQEVGLDPKAIDRYPHEFSGGQRQRIAIARAMILEPRFVMLDEPTSALDMSVQAQIVDLLRGLQDKRKLAYLFISHDLKVVRALCNYVIVMKQGRVVEEGPAEEIFSTRKRITPRRCLQPRSISRWMPAPKWRPEPFAIDRLLLGLRSSDGEALGQESGKPVSCAVDDRGVALWAPSVNDVARVVETPAGDVWQLFVVPHEADAAGVELLLRKDGLFDIDIAGAEMTGLAMTSRDMLAQLLDAIAEGRVVQHRWISSITGA